MKRRKGYAVTIATGSCFYIPHAEHIEKIDEIGMFEDDEDACRAAEKDGVYLDTPENREIIARGLQEWPEYRQ